MIQNKRVIGITGGVGAGKSTVLDYIKAHYHVSVIMADETGRELMEPEESVYLALKAAFGDQILQADGSIDRPALSKICFSSPEEQERVNQIEHPIIKAEIIDRIGKSENKTVFVEAALLKEGGLTEICDEIWVVYASEEVRIERLRAGRGYTREKCEMILDLQLSKEEFFEIADVVIENDRDFSKTEKQLIKEMRRIQERRIWKDAISGNSKRQ